MRRVRVPIKTAFTTAFLSVLAALMLAPSFGQAATVAPFGKIVKIDQSRSEQPVGESQSATPYIVGGGESTFDRHPWLVQITLNGGAFCGGALVHPMLVLTAAHCLYSGGNGAFWYQIGNMEAFTGRTMSATGGEALNIAGVGVAKNYQPLDAGQSGANDWGLIALSTPSNRPVLKIAGPDEAALWRAGREALVAGFGNIAQGGAASPVLKQIVVPLVSDSFCGGSGSYGTAFNPAVMLCAGTVAGGSGTCQGDSGGPLSVPGDGGVRRIVGVVSWADGCAKPNKPTIYSRVAAAAVGAEVNNLAKEAGQALNFPGSYADTNLLGSGAKPLGCSAAQSGAAQAQAGLVAARGALAKAKKAVPRTRKAASKAKKAVTRAKRAARGNGAKAKRARVTLKRSSKKLKKANNQAKRARARLKSANRARAAAQKSTNAAAAHAAATCS